MSEKKSQNFLEADDQDRSQIHKKGIGDFKALIALINMAKEHRRPFFLSLGLILLSGILSIIAARLLGELVQHGLIVRDMKAIILFCFAIIFLELLSLALNWGGSRWLVLTSSRTIYSIRKKLFEHLNALPMRYFDRQPQGRIVTRLTHDVEGLEEFFTGGLSRLGGAFFMANIAAFAMLATNVYLGLIIILGMVPVIFFIYLTRNIVRDMFRDISKYSSALNAKLSEYISGIEVIRGLGVEDWSKEEFDRAVKKHLKVNLDANLFFAWSRPLMSLFCALPLMGLIWWGGHSVMAGALSIGIFVAFIRYFERFYNPVLTLAREIHIIQQAFTSAERLHSFLQEETESEVFFSNEDVEDFTAQGEIEFKNVTMGHDPEVSILKDLSFHILPGEKIGLVGETGCGKTTTVSLLSRLYPFQSGEILIDRVSITKLSRDKLRSVIGFVAQDPILFRSSLKENLCTDEEMSEEDILKYCEITGLTQVMKANQLELTTEITDGGSNLSVGERQLVALTRVLIRGPKILILDEATANIDPYYEAIIQKAIEKVMHGRTCIIIAHRLETLDICHRILVLSQGRLVESGTLQELLQQKGCFYHLKNMTTL